ncbi:MAG: ATP-binding protein [Desulfatitalea sp. BRH_c12]|nr:MAG: ATP-binding protein [Desulfatitalea sp. BRH_c12]
MTSASMIIGAAQGELVRQMGRMANRHGLIAGATGTGKTVTLQVLAEGFSRMGVPVWAADIKGDLSGLATAGQPHPKIDERLAAIGLPAYRQQPTPALFWDMDGQTGHPVRTTMSEIGPLLLSHLLELNETQTGVIYAAFDYADDEGLLLLDLKDLRALLAWMAENSSSLSTTYGNISAASVGAIQRRLLVLEEQGAERFFGEPALLLTDLMHTDFSGRGVVSLFEAGRLIQQAPRVYAAFLLWLMAELFEQLPEAGDLPVPKLVLFFDEAHLLFTGTPKPLVEKIEQVVRLIRSKGVGIYFVTQNPLDIPDAVLGQLGLKIQHALRAFTPKDQKVIRAVAAGFRANPAFNTADILTQLGTGEALVSVLAEDGRPTPVQRTLIAPPEGRIGPIDPEQRNALRERSPLRGKYDQDVDRESAYELLKNRAQASQAAAQDEALAKKPSRRGSGTQRQSIGEAMVKSAARSIGSQLGRQILRGLLGAMFGNKSR